MEYATVVAMLALAQYMYFITKVGGSRAKFDIKAPACDGNDNFERIFRVQQNTLEQLIIFIPALIAFSYYVSPIWGPCIGIIYLLGRFVYCFSYISDPAKRGPGMLLTFIPNAILVIGTIIGAILNLL
jgi:uncharacterized membrane protein YecN with MAPEG domain